MVRVATTHQTKQKKTRQSILGGILQHHRIAFHSEEIVGPISSSSTREAIIQRLVIILQESQ